MLQRFEPLFFLADAAEPARRRRQTLDNQRCHSVQRDSPRPGRSPRNRPRLPDTTAGAEEAESGGRKTS